MKYFNDTIELQVDESWWDADFDLDKNVYEKRFITEDGLLLVTTIYGHIAYEINHSICLFD